MEHSGEKMALQSEHLGVSISPWGGDTAAVSCPRDVFTMAHALLLRAKGLRTAPVPVRDEVFFAACPSFANGETCRFVHWQVMAPSRGLARCSMAGPPKKSTEHGAVKLAHGNAFCTGLGQEAQVCATSAPAWSTPATRHRGTA
eukprot:CAMPEP_0172865088 /NCGR_PEP_ID=MMETSP1075-20121228/81202_1 /TAXON_ID=2916 /ORGANISM="Ceratium fusus, Strain PA161109" /LENGTH=143 /DNA_ID=CAMNT_0013714075 /DNA_START=466 /DNA_END=896 /DNA_ORIENTATION=+